MDVEQLAQWDAEVERLAEHLEQRRAELKKLEAGGSARERWARRDCGRTQAHFSLLSEVRWFI